MVELTEENPIQIDSTVLHITNYILPLTHQPHVQLDQCLILVEFKFIQFHFLLLQHHHQHQQFLQLHEFFHLPLQGFCFVRGKVGSE